MEMIQNFIQQQEVTDIDELNKLVREKFTGPMDEVEYPMDTPSDRAAALSQKAIESFGRRRIQLARKAVAEDPTHVETLVLLAESTRHPEQRIDAFQQASEVGRKELGSLLEEEVGHFWGITQTRPFMRAIHGLANALHAAGQSNDAIEQYKELLLLNPNDNQGIRYEVIPLMLSHNRVAEAIELLDTYREESALWHYMNSAATFGQFGGTSQKSQRAMRAAFKANEYVVTTLYQDDAIPPSPASYGPGGVDEAITCLHELTEAFGETEGFLDFMFAQFFKWEKDRQKKQRDAKRKTRRNRATTKKRKGKRN